MFVLLAIKEHMSKKIIINGINDHYLFNSEQIITLKVASVSLDIHFQCLLPRKLLYFPYVNFVFLFLYMEVDAI